MDASLPILPEPKRPNRPTRGAGAAPGAAGPRWRKELLLTVMKASLFSFVFCGSPRRAADGSGRFAVSGPGRGPLGLASPGAAPPRQRLGGADPAAVLVAGPPPAAVGDFRGFPQPGAEVPPPQQRANPRREGDAANRSGRTTQVSSHQAAGPGRRPTREPSHAGFAARRRGRAGPPWRRLWTHAPMTEIVNGTARREGGPPQLLAKQQLGRALSAARSAASASPGQRQDRQAPRQQYAVQRRCRGNDAGLAWPLEQSPAICPGI